MIQTNLTRIGFYSEDKQPEQVNKKKPPGRAAFFQSIFNADYLSCFADPSASSSSFEAGWMRSPSTTAADTFPLESERR